MLKFMVHWLGKLWMVWNLTEAWAMTDQDNTGVTSSPLRYQELVDMGASCSPRDTCSEDNLTGYRSLCECDQFCAIYGDCCLDIRNRHQLAPRSQSFSCWSLSSIDGVYVRDSCAPGWTNRYIRRRCEARTASMADPFDHVPVTSTRTMVSYKNYYCAICNNDILHASIWNVSVHCPAPPHSNIDFVFSKPLDEIPLIFDSAKNEWGINLNGTYSYCQIQMAVPARISREELRSCYPGMIDKCAPTWRGEAVREKCGSYTAVLFGPNETIYKNAHCAICNHVKPRSLSCSPTFGGGGINGRPAPFPVLLDFTSDSGAPVGKRRRCQKSGEVYDPFFKKCRNMVCGIPKYVLRNGKCVKES